MKGVFLSTVLFEALCGSFRLSHVSLSLSESLSMYTCVFLCISCNLFDLL